MDRTDSTGVVDHHARPCGFPPDVFSIFDNSYLPDGGCADESAWSGNSGRLIANDDRRWPDGELFASTLRSSGLGLWRLPLSGGRPTSASTCGTDPVLRLGPDADRAYQRMRARVHPDDRALLDQAIDRMLAGGAECEVEFRIIPPSGELRWAAVRGQLHRRPNREPELAGIIVDITRRKQAEAEQRRLTEELQAERDRLRAIVEQMPASVLVAEAPSGRIVLANAAVEQLCQHPAIPCENVEEYRAWQGLHPDGRPIEPHEWPLARALRGESVSGEDYRYCRGDGTEVWIRLSGAPICDSAGAVTGAVTVGYCTDRERRAEEVLRASESRLRQLFESPAIGIHYARIDGRITDANDVFLRTVGYTREDLEAGRLNWMEMTPPEYHEADEQNVAELVATGTHLRYERELLRKDGSRVPIAVSSSLLAGSKTDTVSFIQDISDRKAAEAETESLLRSLERSEERYRLAELASDAVIWDHDLRTDHVSFHPTLSSRFGHDVDDITHARSWIDLIHPDYRDDVVASFRAAIDSGAWNWQAEYYFLKSDGSWAWTVDRGYVYRDAAGRPLRAVGAMQDVTARRQREEFERQLIGIVSHDLRNPLNTIMLAAESLTHFGSPDERTRRTTQRIRTASERATRMIRDLLDFTKARLGAGIPIERRSVELGPLFCGLVEEARAAHSDRAIALNITGDTTGVFDADRLAQVLINLVENALKYSPPSSRVSVVLNGDADEVELRVHNEGPAIAPELLNRIFEPMQRGDAASESASRNVGLGLFIVKHLVEAHGGRVDVRSRDDEGTEFTVRLPRSSERPDTNSSQAEGEGRGQAARGDAAARTLDDDPIFVRDGSYV